MTDRFAPYQLERLRQQAKSRYENMSPEQKERRRLRARELRAAKKRDEARARQVKPGPGDGA